MCAKEDRMYTWRGQKRICVLLSHDPQYTSETQSLTEHRVIGKSQYPHLSAPTQLTVRLQAHVTATKSFLHRSGGLNSDHQWSWGFIPIKWEYSHRCINLNPWSTVGRNECEGLGGAAWLEGGCHWVWAFRFQEPKPFLVSSPLTLSLPACYLWVRCELFSYCSSACLPDAMLSATMVIDSTPVWNCEPQLNAFTGCPGHAFYSQQLKRS